MQVTARGWARDMGPRKLVSAELSYMPPVEKVQSYERGETYFQVIRDVRESLFGRRRVNYTIRVSAHAELNLNGSYLVQLELDRDEIAKLFYLTNGDRGLPELFEAFSKFKTLETHGLPTNKIAHSKNEARSEPASAPDVMELSINPVFLKKVDELELSPRSANCLKNAEIVYIGDLVQKTEVELLSMPGATFGRKSVNEIKEVLVQMGLHLGTEIPDWPPENIEELAKQFEDHYYS